MKTAPLSRRDRLRQILADLRMPGALEALDTILQGVNSGTLTAPEAIEQLLAAQIQLRNNRRLQAAMRSSRLPAVKQLRDFDFTFHPSLRREQIESLREHRRGDPHQDRSGPASDGGVIRSGFSASPDLYGRAGVPR